MGDGEVHVTGRPPALRVRSAVAASDSTYTACVLYASAIEAVLREYAGEHPRLTEARCSSRGAPFCEWTIAEA